MIKKNAQDPQAQLDFIKSIMDDSQKVLADNGMGFIVWGILILLAGLLSFILDQFQMSQYVGWAYVFIVSLGWIYMMSYDRKREKQTIGNPLIRKVIGSIWIAVLLSMTILGFVGGASGAINLDYMSAVMYTVLGTAYFLQGVITGKMWVRNLGLAWWGGSIILFFIEGPAAITLMILMMIGLQIVPGIIFNRQWKSHFSED
ncbi:MAG: hypothetical protein ISR87_03200 [Candidatus Marinimicrobia bacterium]|nr:hypothetical protein [FCB group bacterium]MBL7024436.1 hypothetical protein [Candidatus Neomarinimicrobiota bacterium]